MAGLGRKVFTPGEVLRAADVNGYLMDQAVMRFAGTAARGSAIGTATEGMISYLDDINAVQVYDGTAWADTMSRGNIILNSDFSINQRNYASASNLASGSYGFDRWKSGYTNTTLTFTAAPNGQMVTFNTNGVLQQVVERQNVPAGTYVLSWAGTTTGRVYNSGGSAPAYAASPVIATLDGSANVVVEFTSASGTQTLGNVQLEPGRSVSSYRRAMPTYQAELAACQRYYEVIVQPSSVTPTGFINNSTSAYIHLPFKVTKRTSAAVTYVGTLSGIAALWTGGGNTATAFSAPNGIDQTYAVVTTTSGLSGGQAIMFTTSSAVSIVASAEL